MEGGELPIIIPLLDDKVGASLDELDDHLLLLEAARTRLDVEWTEALGVFEERGGHEVHGYPNLVAYLKHRARMSASRANRYVSLARAARKFKATLSSWKHRQVSSDEAELLLRAAQRLPDAYPDAESLLLEMVGDGVDETRKILDYWTRKVDAGGSEHDVEAQLIRRRLEFRRKANGMLEGEFALTQVAGEAFITAIDAAMPPPLDGDDRTAAQRRHDALEDVSRGFLDWAETPQTGGEKPHLNVHVDVDALEGAPGGLHETEAGQVLDVETIRLLACDSSVTRIVWRGDSEILDVGRRTRVVPAALRRAVVARDRHCTWRGCTRPPRWCDVHHLVLWMDGGETALDNLTLLCRYHHTLIHRYEWDPRELLDLTRTERADLARST